jgi:hypothetical protein
MPLPDERLFVYGFAFLGVVVVFLFADKDGKTIHSGEGYALRLDFLHSLDVLIGVGMAIWLARLAILRAYRHAH